MTQGEVTANEGFALARRGLPLAGNRPSQPRAAWLPAAARGPLSALPPRRQAIPAAEEEDGMPDEDVEGEDLMQPRPPIAQARETPAAAWTTPPAPHEAATNPSPLAAPASAGMEDAEPAAGHPAPATAPTTAPGAALLQEPHQSSRMTVPAASPREPVMPATAPLDAAEVPARATQPVDAPRRQPQPGAAPVAPGPQRASAVAAPAGRGHAVAADAPGAAEPRWMAAVDVPSMPQDPQPATPSLAGTAIAATGNAVPVLGQPRADGEAPDRRNPSPAVPLMGLPSPPAVPASRSTAPSAARQDITVLLAPAPTPARSVLIDRVSVTVQAPVPPTPAAASPAPVAARGASRAAAPAGYRNPWSSYHARRD